MDDEESPPDGPLEMFHVKHRAALPPRPASDDGSNRTY